MSAADDSIVSSLGSITTIINQAEAPLENLDQLVLNAIGQIDQTNPNKNSLYDFFISLESYYKKFGKYVDCYIVDGDFPAADSAASKIGYVCVEYFYKEDLGRAPEEIDKFKQKLLGAATETGREHSILTYFAIGVNHYYQDCTRRYFHSLHSKEHDLKSDFRLHEQDTLLFNSAEILSLWN